MKFFIFVIFMAAIASASSKKSKSERVKGALKGAYMGTYNKAKEYVPLIQKAEDRIKNAYNAKENEDQMYEVAGEIIGLVADVQEMMEKPSNKEQCFSNEEENVKAFTEGATEWAKKNIEPAMEKMEEAFKATFENLPEDSKAAFASIKEEITDFVKQLPEDVSQIDPEKVKALWERIQEQLKDVFPAVDESTQEGHKEHLKKGEELMEAAQNFAEKQDRASAEAILKTLVKDQDEGAALKILKNVSEMIKKLRENLGGVRDLKDLVSCLPLEKYAAQMQDMMQSKEL